ncbi:MAG: hypothetical protein R3A47_07885 [Polyangiales bacterium]
MVRSLLPAIAAFVFMVALGPFASSASAQSSLPVRPFSVKWADAQPAISFSALSLGDSNVRKELRSGLRKRLVVTTQSYLERNQKLIETRTFSCSVTYDLWEDGFVVERGRSRVRVRSVQEVLDRCLKVSGLLAGRAEKFAAHRGETVFFAVRAEFNPISQTQCRNLVRSGQSSDSIGPVVINIVRRQICEADSAIEFRSEPVQVPK